MAFQIGDKVTPHESMEPWRPRFGARIPPAGKIYTVSNVFYYHGNEIIEVAEHPQPGFPGFQPGYAAYYWRKVVERKTDISIFTRMLTPDRVDA